MPPLNVVMSNPSAILGCSMHHLKGELGDAPKLKLSDDHKKVLEDSFQDLNKPMKIKRDRNHYPKAIEMPHDLCKKMVESEDESFANLANPRELLADEKRLCKIPAGFPFPLTTLNLRNNCTFSVSSISFSTCTVAELYLGENQLDNNPCKKTPKPFKHKTTKKKSQPFRYRALLLPRLATIPLHEEPPRRLKPTVPPLGDLCPGPGSAAPPAGQGWPGAAGAVQGAAREPPPTTLSLVPGKGVASKPPSNYTSQLAETCSS